MKKIQLALLLSLLLSHTAFAFNEGDGSGILMLLIFIFGGPVVIIVSTISMIIMGFKRALKKVAGPLIGMFFLIEIILLILTANGINIL